MSTSNTLHSARGQGGGDRTLLGIDPGSHKMGYAVVTVLECGEIHYRECGLLTAPKGAPMADRLGELGEGLEQILLEYPICEAAVEDLFLGENVRSAFVLGQARGVVLYLMGRKKIPVHSYSPSRVKKYVTGNGRAPKAQVRKSVTLFCQLRSTPPEDAADALGVALCHAMHLKQPLGGR